MATVASFTVASSPSLSIAARNTRMRIDPPTSSTHPQRAATTIGTQFKGLRLCHARQLQALRASNIKLSSPLKITACVAAQRETLMTVKEIIAKQLSIDQDTVKPHTKFAELGADSLDTVEIMMALEEKFEISIGEGGAENIATVQDAADVIEKAKAGVV